MLKAENHALKEKLRRRDARVQQLEDMMPSHLKAKEHEGHRQPWTPSVKLLAMTLRSAGVGATTTGNIIRFVFRLFGVEIESVPRSTIQEWDKMAGRVMNNLILRALKDIGPAALSWMQDVSSGCCATWQERTVLGVVGVVHGDNAQ